MLSLEIQAGKITPGSLTKYAAQPGDVRDEKKTDKGEIESVILKRGGQEIGWLIGPNREWLTSYEGFSGDQLLTFVADEKANYSVSSDGATQTPLAVYRKSKPNGWAQGPGQLSVRHTLYLKMPQSLSPGKKYTLTFGALNTRESGAKRNTTTCFCRIQCSKTRRPNTSRGADARRVYG